MGPHTVEEPLLAEPLRRSNPRLSDPLRRRVSLGAALAGALFTQQAVSAPQPKQVPITAPAAVGDIRLTLRHIETERKASVRLDSKGFPASSVRESLAVRMELQLSSRFPAVLVTVRRGPLTSGAGFRVTDNLGKTTRNTTAEIEDAHEGPVLRLTAQDLTPSATSLRSVEGSLALFPQAKIVRFHVPWAKDDLPLETEATGAVATLRRFQLVEEDSTLWISVRPPAGLRVAPFDLPGAVEARAVDLYGNLVNNGGITQIEQVRSGAEPEYRFSAPGMRRTPNRLTLDVLCVGGTPSAKTFALRDVRLPAGPR